MRSNKFPLFHYFFEGHIALTSASDEPTNGDDVVGVGIDGSILIDIANGELDWGSVLGGNDSIGIVTFSGEINVGKYMLVVDAPFHLCFEILGSACFHPDFYGQKYNIFLLFLDNIKLIIHFIKIYPTILSSLFLSSIPISFNLRIPPNNL